MKPEMILFYGAIVYVVVFVVIGRVLFPKTTWEKTPCERS